MEIRHLKGPLTNFSIEGGVFLVYHLWIPKMSHDESISDFMKIRPLVVSGFGDEILASSKRG